MLTLDGTIEFNKKTIDSQNLCGEFSDADLDRIGNWASDNFIRDKETRTEWTKRTDRAIDLAMQVQKDKSFPWPNCSNIAFPLVTIAALQFHARAYPAIVNGRSVVQCRVVGGDDKGIATARAERISQHMSWQLLEQDESWEEQEDRGMLNVSIVGVGWKKSYYDAGKGHNVSEFVAAQDLVLDYWAKSVTSCMCKTHIIPMYRNDLYERMASDVYRDCREDTWFQIAASSTNSVRTPAQDQRSGQSQPDSDYATPFSILEQHTWMDLDGDGYAEPYIVTFEECSKTVLRIVARVGRIEDVEFDSKKRIVRIHADEYFTKKPFIPSPDGGIMDIGFGTLLGPLNESVNTSINQLFDSGTINNTAGGFLGRGAKIRGGVYEFKPFGWHRVDATGDDLRKSIVPLPVREPSVVMFNLLGLLIDYTSRISGATDMLVGENPGQNTPAETSRAMLEQGQKVYSAIFKRWWRSMKQEFNKLYTLNATYLPDKMPFGESGEIMREDYSVSAASVIPIADPTIASDGARFARASMILERAAQNPGYNQDAAERQYLRELGVDAVDEIYPGQEGMEPTPDVKIQIQKMKNEVESAKLEQEKMKFMLTMQETVRVNTAKITELMAKAEKMAEEAKSEPGRRNVEAFRAGIEAMREANANTNAHLDRMMENFNGESGRTRTVPGMEGGGSNPDLLSSPAALA
jgi:chaperonin GroES